MILDHIYDAAVDPDAYAALPARLAEAVGARSMSLHTYSARQELLAVEYSYFDKTMMDALVVDEMYKHDLWAQIGLAKAREGRVLSTDDHIRPADFKASVIYNEFFRRFGDDSVHCFGAVFRGQSNVFTMGLHRADRAGAFDAAEVARLQDLVPHIQRAMTVRERLAMAEGVGAAHRETLDQMSVALVRLDRDGRAAFLNAAAEELVRSGDGLSMHHRRLYAHDASAQAALDHAIRQAAKGAGRQAGGLSAPRRWRPGVLRIVVSPSGPERDGSVLVLIDDPDAPRPDLAAVMSQVFGLTAAEAILAEALTQGLTPEEFAQSRAISLNTVRTQVRALLAKTGRRRLTEVVMDLARVAAMATRSTRDAT